MCQLVSLQASLPDNIVTVDNPAPYIDGLVQYYSDSIANALESLQ